MKQKGPLWPTIDSKKDDSREIALNQQDHQGSSHKGQEEQMDDRDLQIAQWIRKMPDLAPPSNFVASVMQSIQPKRLPWIKRVTLWAKSPKSFTFTPIRLAPVAVALSGILFISAYWLYQQKVFRFYPTQVESHIPVVFNLRIPDAQAVAVVGTFNGWKPRGYEMQFNQEKKIWSLTVRLPEGRYEYAFLVDGQRVLPDPESSLYQDDGFGNENSVMILRTKNEKTT
jgi:hypothetical protein